MPRFFRTRFFFPLLSVLILLLLAAGFLRLLNPAPADAGGTGVTSLPAACFRNPFPLT